MNERRRFGSRERAALYIASGGKCSKCSKELEPGWHADHIRPWSRDGQTDVVNGQALCPACNLKKGNNVTDLRQWQAEAFGKLLKAAGNFLVVATPGAGKTRFALVAMQRLIELGEVERVIVVVPTKHLRVQWASEAAQVGIQLDKSFVNGAGAVAADFDGVVVTYAAVAREPSLFRKLSSQRTLVVLDEVHHGGDELAWGEALRHAFEPAVRRLLLSGTPRRTDRKPVPFVTYDDDGNFIWDVKYDYGDALRDHIVRPIEFLALDGEMRWREAGAVVAMALVDAEGDSLTNALGTAIDPNGDWMPSVLQRANDELTQHRTQIQDAGGLLVAADQDKARWYAAMLKRITGEEAVIAISDEPDASARISQFDKGKQRWLIAVQMVSEGVDIKRLTVGVYASRFRTELFFRQVVGRFVRMRTADDPMTATLLIPAIEPLVRYSRAIEATVTQALDEEEEKSRREFKERGELLFDLVEPMSSSEAVHHSTILAGQSFTDEELSRAQAIHEASGMNATVPIAQLAHALRLAGTAKVVGSVTVTAPATPARNLADDKATLRRLIHRKVGKLNRLTDEPHSHIYGRLSNVTDDETVKTATAEMLERRLEVLDRWIESEESIGR